MVPAEHEIEGLLFHGLDRFGAVRGSEGGLDVAGSAVAKRGLRVHFSGPTEGP